MKTSKPSSPATAAAAQAKQSGPNRLRIIGGRWRSTRLQFPDVAAIRPTADRVRETLFNWLQHEIVGARCLDLFAGSGALGLEALSRGASEVVFVDREPVIGRYLRDTLARLQCNDAQVLVMDALSFLKQTPHQTTRAFDVVFLDPPFVLSHSTNDASDALPQLCQRLETQGWLQPNAWLYLECPTTVDPLALPYWPSNWRLHRSKHAGQVGYHLAHRTAAAQP